MARTRAYDAPLPQSQQVPAYRVEEVDGPFLRERVVFDEKTRGLVRSQYTVEKGYLVHFPQGHSMMLDSLEALEEHGFGEVVPLITLGQDAEASREFPPKTTKRVIERNT